jgi:CBS domain-containing protein
METVRSMLRHKGSDIFWVTPEATVYEAVAMMADKSVGALLVLSGGKLAGIVSERDYARKVILKGKHSHEMQVK